MASITQTASERGDFLSRIGIRTLAQREAALGYGI